jgi:LmbE family N-acetylglucosaminyl deacetylase
MRRKEVHRMSRLLVLCPHPDDEAIGCGGTLRRHIVQGDTVHAVFLTSGEQGGHGTSPEATARFREQEARDAAAILGIARVEFWREPDGALRARPELAQRLRLKLQTWRPRLVFVPHDYEDHSDHRAAARLIRRVLASPSFAGRKPTVWMFEIWTPLRAMDQIIDISPYIDVKMAAVRAHKSQCAVMCFDEASLGLSRYRAVMHSGWPPATYAEVFAEMRC